MKEPYGEGLASYTGPESCVSGCKARNEALTGVRAGRVLSREIFLYSGVPTPSSRPEGNIGGVDIARRLPDSARSETPRMYGNTTHGTREIP